MVLKTYNYSYWGFCYPTFTSQRGANRLLPKASINLCRVANLWPLALEIFDAMAGARRLEPPLGALGALGGGWWG
jgi:uncharacterized protein (DUF2384 family)